MSIDTPNIELAVCLLQDRDRLRAEGKAFPSNEKFMQMLLDAVRSEKPPKDAWALYCEAYHALFQGEGNSVPVLSPAALQEMVDRLALPSAEGEKMDSIDKFTLANDEAEGRIPDKSNQLTREQIEAWRDWHNKGHTVDFYAGAFDVLCDMALASLPSSERARTKRAAELVADYRLETSLSGGRDQTYRENARERWLEHIWPDEYDRLEHDYRELLERARLWLEIASTTGIEAADVLDNETPNAKMITALLVEIDATLLNATPQVPVSASLGSVPSEDPGSSLCGESRVSDCGNRNGPVDCPASLHPSATPRIPEGWKLVPIKPTPEMIDAGAGKSHGLRANRIEAEDARRHWDWMIDASPPYVNVERKE